MDNQKNSILLISSEKSDFDLFSEYLLKAGDAEYSFSTAETGADGMVLAESGSFDCIILHCTLSDMDGIDVLLHLLNDDGETDVPVVFISGQGNEVVAVRAMKNGATEYLLKNKLTPHILSMTIRHVIEKKRLQRIMNEYFSFLETLIETIPNPIYYKKKSGEIKGCNKSFEDCIGQPKENIVGKTVFDLLPEKQASVLDQKDKELLTQSGTQFYETELVYGDGQLHNVFINKATFPDLAGDVDGVVEVLVDITEQKKNEEKIKYMALHDALTDLPNRTLFFDRFSQLISRAVRFNQKVSLLYLDLDGFKQVNDTCGHGVGDQVLQEVARRLETCVRASDTVARLGGDEFAILLADVQESPSAAIVAESIISSLEKPFVFGEQECSVGCSIGIANYPDDGQDPDLLLHNADTAMYRVKKNGKKPYGFFSE